MTIQRLRSFLPFMPSLMLAALIVLGLPALSAAQLACPPDGDVDQSGSVTAEDALLVFQQALGLAQLSACQQVIADVFPQPAAPDGAITASDALCIFQEALSLPSCLDIPSPANQPPVADAGLDQTVVANTWVTLAGSGTDQDGTVVSYSWEQTNGPSVTLSSAAGATATFVAPDVSMDESLTFRLTVTDDDGATGSDVVVVTVQPGNQPPMVDAGVDQSADAGTIVVLSGTASDPDGTIASYLWEQTGGTMVALSAATNATAMFTAPDVSADETLTFQLTVTDNGGATDSDDVRVTVQASPAEITLAGAITNHSTGAVIPGALIRVTQHADGAAQELGTAMTDTDGFYAIALTPISGRATVAAEAEDFVPQSVVVNLMEDMDSATADLAMVPVDVAHSFQPTQDTDIMKGDRFLVEVPANSLMTAAGNAPVGDVMAMVTNLDASSDPAVMPGDFMSAAGTTGASGPIESFGAMNMMFRDANGEPLNLSSGQEASVSIPLAGRRDPQGAPETMPLFYWSDERGQWIEEGEAVLEEVTPGKWAYVGTVRHFSTWNADKRYETIWLRGCVKDGDGNPAAFVRVTARGRDYIGSSSVRTDAQGRFDIPVRRDSEVLLTAVDGVHRDSRALFTGSVSRTLTTCLTLMPARCASYVPGAVPERIVVRETTITGPEGLSASGLDVDNASINWRWVVAPIPEPAPPGRLDPNNGVFVAAKAVDIQGPDGLTALGYTIREVANPPNVSGLDQGWNYRRNSDGAKDGLQIYVRGEDISVEYWESGEKLSSASYSDGNPDGWFYSYVNGEKEGIQYYFYGDDDATRRFSFEHRCAGTRHGRTGEYLNGSPDGHLYSYVNGEKEGVQNYISDNYWSFETRSAGTRHGPSGSYLRGEPDGWFYSYVNGEKEGVQNYISDNYWSFDLRHARPGRGMVPLGRISAVCGTVGLAHTQTAAAVAHGPTIVVVRRPIPSGTEAGLSPSGEDVAASYLSY